MPELLMLWCALLFFATLSFHLEAFLAEYDEGPTLQAAALSIDGFRLYDDIVYNKPPLLIWWLNLGMRLGGTSLYVGRLSILWVTFVGYSAFGALAKRWFGPWAGAIAMVLTFTAPDFVARMMTVTNELPALSIICVSLLACTQYRGSRRLFYAIVAGNAFGLAVGFHPLTIYAVVPLGLLLLAPRDPSLSFSSWLSACTLSAMAFGVSALVTLALWLAMVSTSGFYKWVIAYNSAPLGPGLAALATTNLDTLVRYYLVDRWYYCLAFLISTATVYAHSRLKTYMSIVCLWLGATLFTLSRLRPMWPHYATLGLFPLIIGIGGGTPVWLQIAARRLYPPVSPSSVKPATGRIAVTASLAIVAAALGLYLPTWTPWPDGYVALREFISREVDHDEFVAVDNPLAAFIAERRVPPELVDSSEKRISTGYLKHSDIIAAMLRSRVRYLVFASNRFSSLYPLVEWATHNTTLYAETPYFEAYRFTPPLSIRVPLSVKMGDQISLEGFTIQAEQPLCLTTFWKAAQTPSDNYHIFVHLTNGDGDLVGQADAPPLGGALPAGAWPLNTTIPHTIAMDEDLAPGTYALSVGMYSFPDGPRVPVVSADGLVTLQDAVVLTTIEIR